MNAFHASKPAKTVDQKLENTIDTRRFKPYLYMKAAPEQQTCSMTSPGQNTQSFIKTRLTLLFLKSIELLRES